MNEIDLRNYFHDTTGNSREYYPLLYTEWLENLILKPDELKKVLLQIENGNF